MFNFPVDHTVTRKIKQLCRTQKIPLALTDRPYTPVSNVTKSDTSSNPSTVGMILVEPKNTKSEENVFTLHVQLQGYALRVLKAKSYVVESRIRVVMNTRVNL